MSDIMIDLDRNTGLVTVGTHAFKITKINLSDQPGSSGFHYFFVNCECADPSGDDRGKQALLTLSLSPKAAFVMHEFLDAMNAPKKGNMTADQFAKAYEGKFFRATVTHSERGGKTQADLTNLIAYDTPIPSDNMPDDVVEPTGRRGIQEDEEDDVPF